MNIDNDDDEELIGLLIAFTNFGINLQLTMMGHHGFENHRFVSYNRSNRALRILVCGRCACGYDHIRDVCVQYWVQDQLLEMYEGGFEENVRVVIPVRSYDDDFNEVVSVLGGRVDFPRQFQRGITFRELRTFMFNGHPLVNCECKVATRKNPASKIIEESENVSIEEVMSRYTFGYIIDRNICSVMGRNNVLMYGYDEILANRNNMPVGTLLDTSGGGVVLRVIDNTTWFHHLRYKIVHF